MAKFPIPMNEIDVYTIDELKANLDPAVLIEFRKRFVAWLKGADEDDLAAEVKALEQELTDDEWLKAVCSLLGISDQILKVVKEPKEPPKEKILKKKKTVKKQTINISSAVPCELTANWNKPVELQVPVHCLAWGNNAVLAAGSNQFFASYDAGNTWEQILKDIHPSIIHNVKFVNGTWFVFIDRTTMFSSDLSNWTHISHQALGDLLEARSKKISPNDWKLHDVCYFSGEYVFAGALTFTAFEEHENAPAMKLLGKAKSVVSVPYVKQFTLSGPALSDTLAGYAMWGYGAYCLDDENDFNCSYYAGITEHNNTMIHCSGDGDHRHQSYGMGFDSFKYLGSSSWLYEMDQKLADVESPKEHSFSMSSGKRVVPNLNSNGEMLLFTTTENIFDSSPKKIVSQYTTDLDSWEELSGPAVFLNNRLFVFSDFSKLSAYDFNTKELMDLSANTLPEDLSGSITALTAGYYGREPRIIVANGTKIFVAVIQKGTVKASKVTKSKKLKKKESPSTDTSDSSMNSAPIGGGFLAGFAKTMINIAVQKAMEQEKK